MTKFKSLCALCAVVLLISIASPQAFAVPTEDSEWESAQVLYDLRPLYVGKSSI